MMSEVLTISCDESWLSQAKADIFKKKVVQHFSQVTIQKLSSITTITGGAEKMQPDFTMHSLTDEQDAFFNDENEYAIVDRDLLQDVVIFSPAIIEKIKAGNKLILGSPSPLRHQPVKTFLTKALPRFQGAAPNIDISATGNDIVQNLEQLSLGKFDGIVFEAAALNLLLHYEPSCSKIGALLYDKKMMLLPLFECPPAFGQGTLIIKASPGNERAAGILKTTRSKQLHQDLSHEWSIVKTNTYIPGQMGVFHIDNAATSFTYASGLDENNKLFTAWDFLEPGLSDGNLFASTDHMKDFFNYELLNDGVIDPETAIVFIASQKAVHSEELVAAISTKRTWAAGTKTWFDLARKGIWVEGCADGLGLEFLQPVFSSLLINVQKNQIQVITNASSTRHWITGEWNAIATYKLIPDLSADVEEAIRHAGVIFWSSFQQYQLVSPLLQPKVQHLCAAGKTSVLLKAEGLDPFVFPTIKAFTEWRKKHITATAEE